MGTVGFFYYKSTKKDTKSTKTEEEKKHEILFNVLKNLPKDPQTGVVPYATYVAAQKAGLLPGLGPLCDVADWKCRGL